MKSKVHFQANTISYTDLTTLWVEEMFPEKYVIALFDPTNHLDDLKVLNLGHDSLKKLYESKILFLDFIEMEDAKFVFDKITSSSSIYCQMYFFGHYIIDSIDK